MQTTKREILSYVKDLTNKANFNNVSSFTASSISESLSVSRSLASQYLNELHREGYLIKVSSRPVMFLYIDLLKYTQITESKKLEYNSIEELLQDVSSVVENNLFTNVIGYNGSLKKLLNNAKASVSYPPYGLPLFLEGKTGVGKKEIARSLFDYARISGFIDFNKELVMLEVQDTESFKSTLKEYSKNILVGMIYLYNLNNMPLARQELIIYPLLNDYEKQIVLASESSSDISRLLHSKMSFILKVPQFLERPRIEREILIIKFFKEESRVRKREFLITQAIMRALSNYDYNEEILGLKKTIRNICSKAILESDAQDVKVLNFQVYEVLSVKIEVDDCYFNVSSYLLQNEQDILDAYKHFLNECSFESVENFYKVLNNQFNSDDQEFKDYLKSLMSNFNKEYIMVSKQLLKQESILVKMIILQSHDSPLWKEYIQKQADLITSLYYREEYSKTREEIDKFAKRLYYNTGVNLSPIHKLILLVDVVNSI